MLSCTITESIISEGCILKECQVHHSVLGVRSRVESGCVIDHSLLMGADYYQDSAQRHQLTLQHKIPIGIGANSVIRRAIVDKNACIGHDVKIINKDHVEESNREDQGFYIRSGVVVILKNAVISDGTVI